MAMPDRTRKGLVIALIGVNVLGTLVRIIAGETTGTLERALDVVSIATTVVWLGIIVGVTATIAVRSVRRRGSIPPVETPS